MLDFVIINYNTAELTCKCIKSIYDSYGKAEIVVVDNASKDNSVQVISSRYPEVKIIANSINVGYAKAVNIGFKETNCELSVICNSDVEFLKDSIQITEKMMNDDKSIGIAGFNQFYPDLSPQRSYGFYPGYKQGILDMLLLTSLTAIIKKLITKLKFNKNIIIYPEYADGASLMIRSSLFKDLNGFDEDFFFFTEETDYCRRVWKSGFKVALNLNSKIIHHRGASRINNSFNVESEKYLISTKLIFIKKHSNPFEVKFFKFTQIIYFKTISFLEAVLSIVLSDNNLKKKCKNHLEISKLWKDAKTD